MLENSTIVKQRPEPGRDRKKLVYVPVGQRTKPRARLWDERTHLTLSCLNQFFLKVPVELASKVALLQGCWDGVRMSTHRERRVWDGEMARVKWKWGYFTETGGLRQEGRATSELLG